MSIFLAVFLQDTKATVDGANGSDAVILSRKVVAQGLVGIEEIFVENN